MSTDSEYFIACISCVGYFLIMHQYAHTFIHQKLVAMKHERLECGPMPNVMAALPNIDGAFCSTPPCLADAHYQTSVQ